MTVVANMTETPIVIAESGGADRNSVAPGVIATSDEKLSWLKRGHVPSLDGLRGVSVLLVCFCHGAATYGSPVSSRLYPLAAWGGIGVDVFFVISGFIITLLLLRERDRTGSVSIRCFYLRRLLRIAPAFVVFLLFVAVLGILRMIELPAAEPDCGRNLHHKHLWCGRLGGRAYLVAFG